MLTPALRSRLRTQIQRTMPTSVAVQRRSMTRDAEGDAVETWTTVATVLGRIGDGDRQAPQERVAADRLQAETTWTVALPAETDVTAKDRLVAGGVTYAVIGVLAPMSFELERRCVCVVAG